MENHHRMSENLKRIIMKYDTSSSVATEDESNLQQFQTFREKLAHLLHSHKFKVGVVILVIFDCLLVIGEPLIDLHMLKMHRPSTIDPRCFYGSPEEFASLFEDLIVCLEMAQQIDSFSEYRYHDQFCFALCHMMSLIEEKDLEYLRIFLTERKEQLEMSMNKFREKMTFDKEEILSKVVTSFDEFKNDDIQKQHILQLFSVPDIN